MQSTPSRTDVEIGDSFGSRRLPARQSPTSRLPLTLSLMIAGWLPVPLSGDIIVGGDRPVTVRVPSSYDDRVPTPLILFLHGFTNNGTEEEDFGVSTFLESEHFLFASPDGSVNDCGLRQWNATDACCRFFACESPGPEADDSGYLASVIGEIESLLNVDARRIHLMGYSNGGFMAYRMACEHADKIASIAVFAGAVAADTSLCQPASPVHVLHVHGTADDVVLFDGGVLSAPFPGANLTVERWAGINGCEMEREIADPLDLFVSIPGAETAVERITAGCRPGGSVELWSVRGGGHFVYQGSPAFTAAVIRYLLDHPESPVVRPGFTWQPDPEDPSRVVFDASGSTSPDGAVISAYEWDFGDGTVGEGRIVEHAYGGPGRYRARLTILTDRESDAGVRLGDVQVGCPTGDVTPMLEADVGSPAFPGASDSPDGTGTTVVTCAGGEGIARDSFHFAYTEVSGDFQVSAHVATLTSASGAQAGVVARTSLEGTIPMAAMLVETDASGESVFRLRYRQREGQLLQRVATGDELANPSGWVRMERRGTVVSGWISTDGESWSLLREVDMGSWDENVLVGVGAGSRDTGASPFAPASVRFENIHVSRFDAFLRGGCNDDGRVDISDVVCTLNWLFGADSGFGCPAALDTNGDGAVNISDPVYLLGFLFSGGPDPIAPFPDCGPGTLASDARLGCAAPPSCR